jgi:hypothetical protein
MSVAYFTTKNGTWFTPSEHSRGPWDVTACHAGPPVALMVRAVEALVPNQQLARLTVELIRPIPMAGFRVQAEVRRPGRSVTHTEAEIYDDDRSYARAYGMHIRTAEDAGWGEAVLDGPAFPESVPGHFPLADSAHSEEWFGGSVECRYDVASPVVVGGPTTIWMKTQHPVVADEAPSPFQRIAPLSDCGNGISYNATVEATSFVNADLTLSLHREPVGDWFASRSVSHWQSSGIGLADSELFDVRGAGGRATQSLILARNS